MDSTRADIYSWVIDIEKHSANQVLKGYRQHYSRQPPLNTESLAKEIAELIFEHKDDERLKGYVETGNVKMFIGKIIPEKSAAKATITYRRKKLRTKLEQILISSG